jgi:photosystem II stability/assembly factor-like uncharacterized protein
MRRFSWLLALWGGAAWGVGSAGAAALRGLAVDGKTCWAVGDAGTILRSDDSGLTWTRLASPAAANFQSAYVALGQVFLFGGQAVPGHPTAQARGVILRTADRGRSFQSIPAGPAGWLYGGSFAGRTAVAYGQANYAAGAGILYTIDGGRLWHPASVTSRGFLLDGDFHSPRYGYLVGSRGRIVSLRDLAEPRVHPPATSSPLALRAVRFADESTCWCVGDNAAVHRSGSPARPWQPVPINLPPGARRCADLEAVAFASPRRAWLAGGLLGVVPRTENGGGSWQLLPAPGPGAVRALALTADGALLAAGDGERIWRSGDGGRSWRLVHGRERTDVLFAIAAGDRSVYPAMVAHALAGDSVAVVFATHLPAGGGTPADQPLRAAAAWAGADAVTALTEFPSVAADPAAGALSAAQIAHRWSIGLDIPAEEEMVRQLAAAIRLHRPAVLAVGPDAEGARGRRAENHLVARLAQQAAARAADEGDLTDLAKAGLAPWRVRRTFVGLEVNEQWHAPWQDPPRVDRAEVAASFPAEKFPARRELPLGLLAAAAVWRLPGMGLLDRPGGLGAYRCAAVERPVRLFTTGLGKGRLPLSSGDADQRMLATCAPLRAAIARGRTYAAATDLIGQLERARTPEPAALAADRLLLIWWRLLEEGKLIQADLVMARFLKAGRHHPLYRKMNVLALAAAASAECKAQLRARGRPEPMGIETLQRAANALAGWPTWCLSPPGRMLHAKALLAAGQLPQARKIVSALSREPYEPHWRRCALLELGGAASADAALRGRRRAVAAFVAERGRLDGRLTEAAWQQARVFPLLAPTQPGAASGRAARLDANAPAPTVQAVRSAAGFVLFAVRLPHATGRQWELDLAIDSDRDTWTQIVVHWDTGGTSTAGLAFRNGPTGDLGRQACQILGQRTRGEWTFELALGLNQFATRPPPVDLWYFQLRAAARDAAGERAYYFQRQGDGRLLPERYGLLKIPAARDAREAGQGP